MDETNNWFFGKTKKADKPLARWTKKRFMLLKSD